eukprot:Skav201711  [mRNA]  locus=scaffold311:95021:95293:- [translate_table: standard]
MILAIDEFDIILPIELTLEPEICTSAEGCNFDTQKLELCAEIAGHILRCTRPLEQILCQGFSLLNSRCPQTIAHVPLNCCNFSDGKDAFI